MNDEDYMQTALNLAKEGMEKYDEVPVGCVIVKDGKIIATSYNEKEKLSCATKHAEILAIERASEYLKDWHLNDCTLYVTIEPCCMCCGAIINARLKKVVYGADDLKTGCVNSVYRLFEDNKFNHKPDVTIGVLKDECSLMISEFFKKKRN